MSTAGPDRNCESVRAHLSRIAASPAFVRAGRMYPLLEYVVEAELAGVAERLNQHRIAVDVFGRDERFDPSVDSIVRVEMGRLRNKLREYYATSGRDDAVTFELPKGRYRPTIRARDEDGVGGPGSAPEPHDHVPRERGGGTRGRGFVLLVAAVASIALLAAGWALTGGGDATDEAGRAAKASAPPGPSSDAASTPSTLPNSIAVLPFENLSAEEENAYFAVGMHEALLDQLQKIRGLNVIPRTSVLRYEQSRPPIPEIAAQLGVQSVLEGSVGIAGENVVVRVALVDAASDAYLWSQRYDRPSSGAFDVQADIAATVAEALRAKLSPTERRLIREPPTRSPEAYALYLKTWAVAPEERFALLDSALEIDPSFASAAAMQAFLYSQSLTNTAFGTAAAPGVRAEREELVRRYARRTLEADPSDPYANVALGNLYFFTWQWREARAAYERAAASSPNDATLLHYAYLDAYSGHVGQAMARTERLVRLNPSLPVLRSILGLLQGIGGRYDAAVPNLEASLEAERRPDTSNLIERSWLAAIRIAHGENPEALRQLQILEQLGAEDNVSLAPFMASTNSRSIASTASKRCDVRARLAAILRIAAQRRRCALRRDSAQRDSPELPIELLFTCMKEPTQTAAIPARGEQSTCALQSVASVHYSFGSAPPTRSSHGGSAQRFLRPKRAVTVIWVDHIA